MLKWSMLISIFILIQSASAIISIENNVSLDLDNGAYIQIIPGDYYESIKTYNSSSATIQNMIELSNTTTDITRFNNSANTTISDYTFNSTTTLITFTGTSTSGTLNMSTKLIDEITNYYFYVDDNLTSTIDSSATYYAEFNYSDWSTHNFTIGYYLVIHCNGICYIAEQTGRNLSTINSSLNDVNVIWNYNSTSKKYEGLRSTRSLNENVTIAANSAFVYESTTTQNISYATVSNTPINLITGWNLVGNLNRANRTILQLKTSIGANATWINSYNGTGWDSDNSSVVQKLRGFFVYVTSNTTWSG